MAKGKTPQEIYKERKAREIAERDAYLPPGLVNHGNTCFMNSVLQGLIATTYLEYIVHMNLTNSRLSPALTNGRGEQFELEWTEGMKLADTFLIIVEKAWKMKYSRQRVSMSPKEILSVLGTKYDQYNDFRQQDAHEFLRFLLDAMRMEEFDVIKKRQPPPPKQRKSTYNKKTEISEKPLELRLASFVDMVFGGKLASILICETCKKVSVTNEPFDDLSLSIKPDEAKERKRDRFLSFAQKLMQRDNFSVIRPQSAPPPSTLPPDTMSLDPRRQSLEKELTDSRELNNFIATQAVDGVSSKLGRRMSVAWKKRRSRKKEMDRASDLSSREEIDEPQEESTGDIPPFRDSIPQMTTSPHPNTIGGNTPTPSSNARSPSPSPTPSFTSQKTNRDQDKRARSAYIRGLLADSQTGNPLNPFSYLPSSAASWTKFAPTQGLEQCLRQFTAVELLEGDNMVGCHQCWKLAHDKHEYSKKDEEDDEDSAENDNEPLTATINSRYHLGPPGLSDTTSASPASTSAISAGLDLNVSSLDLTASVRSLPSSFKPSSPPSEQPKMQIPEITTEPPHTPITSFEAPPPIVHFRSQDYVAAQSMDSLRTPEVRFGRNHRSASGDSLSEVSSEESSDEALSDSSATSSSKPAVQSGQQQNDKLSSKRDKTKEVIMRRAYKRYLIAMPPPVLVIHLKRFQQVSKGSTTFFGNLKKLDDYIPFPEYLDLSGYLAPNPEDFGLVKKKSKARHPFHSARHREEGNSLYRLVAVVVHIGNMLGGHYVAYTALPNPKSEPPHYNGTDGQQISDDQVNTQADPAEKSVNSVPRQWCYISDTVVRLTSLDEVLKSKAYICIYERLDTLHPSAAKL